MLYTILKSYTRLLVRICYHSIEVDNRDILKLREAVLIASNHPNSFLDAVIFDILFDMPVTSLARGDAFKNPRTYKILRSLNMLPIYRKREGAEHLNNNYDTFDECVRIFRKKEGVLIFSEGLCENEWHLRPLMKGTARLAFKTWQEDVDLKVLPAGINYSSFTRFGKKIKIHFGNYIHKEAFNPEDTDGYNNTLFNTLLRKELSQLVYEIAPDDQAALHEKFGRTPLFRKILLAPFALAGILLHWPLYLTARFIADKYFHKMNHYDSIMFAIPLLAYPVYMLAVTLITGIILQSLWAFSLLLVMPLSALAYAKYEVRKG